MASGFSQADAQGDFSRARRARLLADIGRRLRREPDDVALILPFEEVIDALGVVGREDLGLLVVCSSEAIAKTFKITGLDGVFTLAGSVDDALSDDATAA